MCTKSQLDAITEDVVRAARDVLGDKLDKVLLYGSYARGDYDDESDIDIMVLADVPAEDELRTGSAIRRAANDWGLTDNMLLSINVTDCKRFYKWLDVVPYYQNVMKDGVSLSA